jgi:hypothetical protein
VSKSADDYLALNDCLVKFQEEKTFNDDLCIIICMVDKHKADSNLASRTSPSLWQEIESLQTSFSLLEKQIKQISAASELSLLSNIYWVFI